MCMLIHCYIPFISFWLIVHLKKHFHKFEVTSQSNMLGLSLVLLQQGIVVQKIYKYIAVSPRIRCQATGPRHASAMVPLWPATDQNPLSPPVLTGRPRSYRSRAAGKLDLSIRFLFFKHHDLWREQINKNSHVWREGKGQGLGVSQVGGVPEDCFLPRKGTEVQ